MLNYSSLFKAISASFFSLTTIALVQTMPVLAEQPAQFRIHNRCSHPVKVAIWLFRYYPECAGGQCQENPKPYEDGFWHVDAYQRIGVTDRNGRPVLMWQGPYNDVLFYAETTDNTHLVWRGSDDHYHTSNLPNRLTQPDGSPLRYRNIRLGEHRDTLNLDCN